MALNASQRKAKIRKENKARGLVMLYIPEIWITPEQSKKLQKEIAIIIAKTLSPEIS